MILRKRTPIYRYWVKAYFVMQAAVLCYFLESLACSGLSVVSFW